jgi:hypothetical protein
MRAMQSEAEAPPPDAGNVVRLMTIHAAKGLEFPVVFVSALNRGTDRRRPVIAFSPGAGLGAKWRNPANGKGQSDFAHASVVEELKRKEEAEENRLLYVAATRAEQRLIFSYAARGRSSAWRKLVVAAVPARTMPEQAPDPPARPVDAAADTDDVIVAAPAPSGQHDSSAAVTAVATFNACPRKYFLGDYLGFERPVQRGVGSGERAVEVGLEVHRILAGESPGSPEAAELANRFISSELGQRAARATRMEREFDFLLPVGDVVLRGQIDLWFE